ncbi:MAG: Fur family transcriptional regulator [bacterium]|nr:Fur family transcriptional regulator [bacterium]
MDRMPIQVKNTFNPVELRGLLRTGGLKATRSRLAILGVMRRTKHPLSPQEIIERLGKSFDQATIYRFIKKLQARGIIRQIDLRHNHAHYELFDLNDHHHLICMRCGRIEDVSGCEIEDAYNAILRSAKDFSEIRQHSLEFYGICRNCGKHKA